jgi:hypothetical protein
MRRLQDQANPLFRLVTHHGQVFMGGVPTLGEESLSGPEVTFVFRMERLAGSLKQHRLMSEAARGQLAERVQTRPAGEHSLPGFPGHYPFFSF